MKKFFVEIALLLTSFNSAVAQDWKALSTDDLYKLARQTAYDGNRTDARVMLGEVINRSSTYYEVRTFLARTYAWDGQYDQAKRELAVVLSVRPTDAEALGVLLDVDLWREKYSDALVTADKALATHPSSEDFLYKKAVILKNLQRPKEAASQLNLLLELDPSHAKGAAMMRDLKIQLMRHYVGISSGFDSFNKIYSSAFSGSVNFGTTHTWGTSLMKMNYSDRFSLKGFQPEIEIYPRIANGVYAYVNYGYSQSALFPQHRIGGELFSKLPRNFEASLGGRYLNFNTAAPVVLFTGSIGYYFANYWLSLRPFISRDGVGTYFSATGTARLYFSTNENYLGISFGYGFSPDERRIQSSNGLSTDVISALKSQRYGVVWQKTLRSNFIVNLYINLTYQELSVYLGDYVWITSGSIWLRKRF